MVMVMVAGALVLPGCGSQKEPGARDAVVGDAAPDSTAIAADSPERLRIMTYEATGTPRKIDMARGEITIEHEKIEGFMEAMTMPFKVADPAMLKQVTVGKPVRFTLRVAGWEMTITKIGDEQPEVK